MRQTLSQVLQYFECDGDIQTIREIDDGHLHRVYQVNCAKQRYIIKRLKPRSCRLDQVFSTEQADYLNNFAETERIAAAFAKQGIAAVTALCQQTHYYVLVGDSHYAVYPHIAGNMQSMSQMQAQQAQQIGACLYRMHQCRLDLPAARPFALFQPQPPWQVFLRRYFPAQLHCFVEMQVACECYYHQQHYDVISHRDITCRNVIWQAEHYHIIDWELAGWIDPMVDLLSAAFDISLTAAGWLDIERFQTVLHGYSDIAALQQRFEASFYGVCNIWLAWAYYNIALETEASLQAALHTVKVLSHLRSQLDTIKQVICTIISK